MRKWMAVVMIALAVLVLAVPVLGDDGQALKWQARANGIFRTETEHFVVFVHVGPGKDKNNEKAAAAAEKLEHYYTEASALFGSELDVKWGVVFDAAKGDDSLSSDGYRRLYDGPLIYIWSGFNHAFDRPAASIIAKVMLLVKMDFDSPPEWLLDGFGEWFYSSYCKHVGWPIYRTEAESVRRTIQGTSIRVGNPLAGPSKWGRKPDTIAKIGTYVLDRDPHYSSVFYFLESAYGLDRLKSFLAAWGESGSFERALKDVFEADTKTLETKWRPFILFEGVSDFEWTEGKKDYRATVEGMTVSLKRTKTLWYNKALEYFIVTISRAMTLTHQLTGVQPQKPPVLTIDAFAAKPGIKSGRDGATVSYVDTESDKLMDAFIAAYAAQAFAGLKSKSMPRWVEPGMAAYINAKSVGGLGADELRNALDGTPIRDWGKLSSENDFDTIAALFEFLNVKYGNQAVARLVAELGGGAAMDSAMQAVTGKTSDIIKNEFIRFVALPSESALKWSECTGGVTAEVGASTVVLKLDKRLMVLGPAEESIIQSLSEIEGNLRALTGRNEKVNLTLEAVEDFAEPRLDGTSLYIPLTSGQLDSFDAILIRQMVRVWLTRSAGGRIERIPAWLGEGLCGLIAARMDSAGDSLSLRENLSSVKVDPAAWSTAWVPGDVAEDVDLWQIAVDFMAEKYAGRIPAFLSALAESNVDAAMTRAFGINLETFVRQWEMYTQVEMVSELKWTPKGRTPLSVSYETRVGNVRVTLGMGAGELVFQPGDDSLVAELDQWVAQICKSLGISEAGPVSVTLHLNARSDLPVISHQGLDVVAVANGDIAWSTRQSIAFELGRALVEEKWRRSAAGSPLPVWLRDGIAAMYVYLIANGTETMTLYGQESLPGFAEIIASYDPASLATDEPTVLASVFSFLHRAHPGSLGRLLEQMGGGLDFQSALLRATGRDAASLESAWKAEQTPSNE